MKRPILREIPVNEVIEDVLHGKGIVIITMSPGQWDGLLSSAYDVGQTLLELNSDGSAAAFRKLQGGRK